MADKKFKLTDEELVEYIQACYTESNDYFTDYIKPVMDECWDLYNVKRDYSKKKAWQSKNVGMRAFASVETAISLVKRSLISAKNFYTVNGQDKKDKLLEPLVKGGIDFYLRKAKFYQKFIEALKMAFIAKFGVLKIYWKRWEEKVTGFDFKYTLEPVVSFGVQTGFKEKVTRTEKQKTIRKSELVIESIDPYNIRLDPFSKLNIRPKYIIEIEDTDFSNIKKLEEDDYYGEKAGGVSVDSVIGKEIIKEAEETRTAKSTDMTLQAQGTNQQAWVRPESASKDIREEEVEKKKMVFRKPCTIIHFWGDLESVQELEDGKQIKYYENWNIDILNGEYVIRKKKNPHTHGKFPYIIIPCILSPYRAYPISLIEPARAAMDYQDDLQNACLDALKFEILNMYGVDATMLEDPINDLVIEPGHFIKFNAGGQNINTAIQNLISRTPSIAAAFNMIKWQDNQTQMGLGVIDPLMGMMVQGDTTATEYRGTLGQSTGKFMSIAQDIEEFSVAPIIEMVYQLILQNMDIDSPMWIEITGESGEPLREYVTPERIAGNFDFYATGMTGYLHQLEYISKMVSVFSTMVQAAPILQLTPEEARKTFKKIIKAQGIFDIDEIISDAPNIQQMATQGMAMEGGGEQQTQPMSPEMAPENVLQMLNKGGMM